MNENLSYKKETVYKKTSKENIDKAFANNVITN